MSIELSGTLREFLFENIPTFEAAETLLFLMENRDRDFSAEEIVVAMRPRVITVAAVSAYATLLTERRLLTEIRARFRYSPASRELEHAVGELSRAYAERPVTLIIAIHHIADGHVELNA